MALEQQASIPQRILSLRIIVKNQGPLKEMLAFEVPRPSTRSAIAGIEPSS